MQTRILCVSVFSILILPGCSPSGPEVDKETLQQQVMETERTFARTMVERDLPSFTSFLAEEAIFFSGDTPSRGKQQVADDWKRFYETPDPPFTWEPERVEVLESGGLALSTGPVRDPSGKIIATFTSIWRQESPGIWRIVFDKGNRVCEDL